jgi:predicted secreted Zn-dependent protease
MCITRACVGVLAILVPATVVQAEVCSVTPTYSYYSVTGNSAEELEDSLRQNGPRDELGAVRFAYTDWTVKWNWKRQDDGTIDLRSVQLTCLATILLPKVDSREGWTPDLSLAWDAFVERTRHHELNHVGHVEQLAPRILDRLDQVATQLGRVSAKRAESIVADVIAQIRAKDREYDATTRHGRTEGTWKIQHSEVGL